MLSFKAFRRGERIFYSPVVFLPLEMSKVDKPLMRKKAEGRSLSLPDASIKLLDDGLKGMRVHGEVSS